MWKAFFFVNQILFEKNIETVLAAICITIYFWLDYFFWITFRQTQMIQKWKIRFAFNRLRFCFYLNFGNFLGYFSRLKSLLLKNHLNNLEWFILTNTLGQIQLLKHNRKFKIINLGVFGHIQAASFKLFQKMFPLRSFRRLYEFCHRCLSSLTTVTDDPSEKDVSTEKEVWKKYLDRYLF